MYYFIYSKRQQDKQEQAYRSAGKTYVPGKVTVNGKAQVYTSIVKDDLKTSRQLFGDINIITMVESLSSINYTKPTANAIRRVI